MDGVGAKVSVDVAFDLIKVRIGGVLHLAVQRSKLLGVQGWKWAENNYAVEFTMTSNVILAEYDNREKFEAVMRGLDEVMK